MATAGTGKTHLLIGLGIAACERGLRVRYVTAAALVNELVEAEDERELSRVIGRYGRIDLLCLDELDYLHLDRRGAELLFQVLTERDERASIAVASSAPFSEWGQTFTDPRLAAAVGGRAARRHADRRQPFLGLGARSSSTATAVGGPSRRRVAIAVAPDALRARQNPAGPPRLVVRR